jgi:hypothetical protein
MVSSGLEGDLSKEGTVFVDTWSDCDRDLGMFCVPAWLLQ